MKVYQVVASFHAQVPVLISADIVKETAVYYYIERNVNEPESWHWSSRIEKSSAHITVADAWSGFKDATQRDIDELKIKLDVRRARMVHVNRALAELKPAASVPAVAPGGGTTRVEAMRVEESS